MLYDQLFVSMESARWDLSRDIDFDAIEPARLTPRWIDTVREVYALQLASLRASEMFLGGFRADIDFCSFVSVWFYEEMEHHLVLRKYLERVGEVVEEAELPRLRLTFAPGPAIETLTMHFCGEQRLAHWYTAFSANAPEPVLRQIFKVLAADELRHAAAYAKYLRKAVRNNPAVLPTVLRMSLWMIRSSNDSPKHPTTITDPSVVSMLEDPTYIRRMLNMYLPGRDHEAPVRQRILALMTELSGHKLSSVRDLLSEIRALEGAAPEAVPVG
jgi:hypothetical protein